MQQIRADEISEIIRKRIEDFDKAVGLINHILEGAAIIRIGLCAPQSFFGAIAQSRQRRLQIMSDIVRDFLQAAHQLVDAIEHGRIVTQLQNNFDFCNYFFQWCHPIPAPDRFFETKIRVSST